MEIYYTIYQTEKHDYLFMPFNYASKHGLDLLDYEQVANSVIEMTPEKGEALTTSIDEILDSLFRTYNLHVPKWYKGRLLSMSDVVVLTVKAGDVCLELGKYYCDTIGWKKF